MKQFSRNYGWRTEVITIQEDGTTTADYIDNKTGITFKSDINNMFTDFGWKDVKGYIQRLKDLKYEQLA